MLPTSLALAWPLWRRHRWGLLAILGYLACAVFVTYAMTMVRLDPQTVNFILGPMSLLLIGPAVYLITIFSLGFDADISARESCFPAGLFRLPVRTGALVGWPMAYGAAAILLFWLITGLFILRPWLGLWDVQLPLWWPAALAIAIQACFQTVLWVPLGLALSRIVLLAVLIPALVAATQRGVETGVPEGLLVGAFLGLAGLAWLVGYVGVRHARRGDVPNWDFLFQLFHRLGQALRRPQGPFARAARAQLWFEWRRTGWSLPVLTAVTMPFVLMPLLFGPNDAIPASRTVLTALLIPAFLAGLAGTTVSGNHPWVKDYYGVAPFTATLPMTSARLVGAKLKAAAMSTLVTWMSVAATLPVALMLTGHYDEVMDFCRQWLGEQRPVKVAAGAVATTAFLILWTWKRLADSLLLGLTGRKWLIQGSIFAGMAALVMLAAIAAWVYRNPEYRSVLLAALPWILAAWILCRVLATGWALRLILRNALMDGRSVLCWLVIWMAMGLALIGSLAWIVPDELVPRHYLVFAVLLVMPMARLAITPLALTWNRHR